MGSKLTLFGYDLLFSSSGILYPWDIKRKKNLIFIVYKYIKIYVFI